MSESKEATKKEGEEAVKRLIMGSAPERISDFEALWKKHKPEVEFTDNKMDFNLTAGPYGLLLFDHRTMNKLWLVGFAAQRAFQNYGGGLHVLQLLGADCPTEEIQRFFEQTPFQTQYSRIITTVKRLAEIGPCEDFDWPEEVPPAIGKPTDLNGMMAFDLLCIGAGFCFLHELNHIILASQPNHNLSAQEEEFACDRFARDFLLDEVVSFSDQNGVRCELVKTKRLMGMGLISLLFLTITPKRSWLGSSSHPSIFDRIDALTEGVDIPDDDYFWIYMCCILLAELALCTKVKIGVFSSHKERFKSLVTQLAAVS